MKIKKTVLLGEIKTEEKEKRYNINVASDRFTRKTIKFWDVPETVMEEIRKEAEKIKDVFVVILEDDEVEYSLSNEYGFMVLFNATRPLFINICNIPQEERKFCIIKKTERKFYSIFMWNCSKNAQTATIYDTKIMYTPDRMYIKMRRLFKKNLLISNKIEEIEPCVIVSDLEELNTKKLLPCNKWL